MRMEDLREADCPGLHRYGPTAGIPPLVDAIAQKLRERNRLACEREQVLVTAGATSGLACAVAALCDPGEEVLICAPFWPLIRGMVRSQRAMPVEVPFFDRVATLADALAALDARRTPRTVALYFSNPSNPTGRVLAPDWIEALAGWARRHDLWILVGRGIRGVRLPRRARLDRALCARAHALLVLVLEDVRHGGQPRRLSRGPRGGRSPRRTRSRCTRPITRPPRRSSPRCARSKAAPGG